MPPSLVARREILNLHERSFDQIHPQAGSYTRSNESSPSSCWVYLSLGSTRSPVPFPRSTWTVHNIHTSGIFYALTEPVNARPSSDLARCMCMNTPARFPPAIACRSSDPTRANLPESNACFDLHIMRSETHPIGSRACVSRHRRQGPSM